MILSSPHVFWPPEGKTVPEAMLEAAAKHTKAENKAYLIDGATDERRYFSDLENETRRIASHFYRKGLRKGDTVIFMSLKQVNLIIMQCGIWRANGILRALYVEETLETILTAIKESKSRWLVCDSEIARKLSSIGESVGWPVEIIICEKGRDIVPGCKGFEEYLEDDGSLCPNKEIGEDDIAVIIPTSGTTGPCKGAIHTHKSLLLCAHSYFHVGYRSSLMNVALSRAVHVSGFVFPISMILWDSTVVVSTVVTPEILAQTIEKYKGGCVFAMLSFVLKLVPDSELAKTYDLSSLEFCITGGSPVTPAIMKTLLTIGNMKQVIVSYGMTECPAVASTRCFDAGTDSLYQEPENYPNILDFSVGKVFPGTSVQFRDVNDSTKILGPGERGELCVKGNFVFKGYFQDEEKTRQAFVDGWMKSGDVGFYDKEGFIYILDRCKDTFKYDGNHMSPTEIENVLHQHPLVSEACVIGVSHLHGEVPKAFVTLVKSHADGVNRDSLAEDIKDFANSKLSSYKHIRGGLVIIDEMPKGKAGKVARNLLRDK